MRASSSGDEACRSCCSPRSCAIRIAMPAYIHSPESLPAPNSTQPRSCEENVRIQPQGRGGDGGYRRRVPPRSRQMGRREAAREPAWLSLNRELGEPMRRHEIASVRPTFKGDRCTMQTSRVRSEMSKQWMGRIARGQGTDRVREQSWQCPLVMGVEDAEGHGLHQPTS